MAATSHIPGLSIRTVRRVYPYLLLTALIAGIGAGMAIGGLELTLLGLVTVGPPFLLCTVVLLGGETDAATSTRVADARVPGQLYVFVVSILFAGSVLAVSRYDVRPLAFFVLLAGLYVTMFVQLWDGASSPAVVLGEIVATLALAIYSVTLKYGLYFGGTDTLLHSRYAEITFQTGSLVPPSVSAYGYFPLYHVFVAEGMHVLGVESALATFLLTPLPFLATVLFVYEIADYLLDDRTDALLAALFFSLLPNVVYYGQYMVTRVMAFVAFVMVLYLLYLFYRERRPHYLLLIGVASLFLLLVHQVSALQVLALLGALAVAHWFAGDESAYLWKYFALLSGLVALYWGVVATEFAHYLLTSRLAGLSGGGAPAVSGGDESLFNHATFYANRYAVILLTLLGVGGFIASESRTSRVAVGLFALFTIPLYIPNPLHALWETIRLLRLDRFLLLLTPFLAILMAAGLRTLSSYARRVTGRGSTAFLAVLLVFGLCAGSATASPVAPVAADAEDVEWTGPPLYFEESELQSFERVDAHTTEGTTIYADWHASRYYAGLNEKTHALDGDRKYEVEPILDVDTIREAPADSRDHVIVRDQRLRENGLPFGNGVWYNYDPTEENVEELNAALADHGRIYDNGAVSVRLTPSEE